MNNLNKKLKNEIINDNGFTLLEVLISMAIFVVIVIILAGFQSDVFRINSYLQAGLNAQQEAKKILRPFAEEIRSASVSNIGGYPIEKATMNEIIFYSDIDNDEIKERIRYFRDNNSFKKGVIKPEGNPFVYDVDNEKIVSVIKNIDNGSEPIFRYFNSIYDGNINNEALNYPIQILEISLVEAKIFIKTENQLSDNTIEISTKATFRNLKD